RIARDVLDRTKDRSVLTDEEKTAVERLLGPGNGKCAVTAGVGELPVAFLKALLDDTRLSPNQRAVVSMHLHGMTGGRVNLSEVYDTTVASPVEFGSAFIALGSKAPNCELFLNGRWYPVTLNVQFVQDRDHLSKTVLLQGNLSLCEAAYGVC